MLDSQMLDIRALSKTFGAQPAVRDLSLSLQPGEILALIGPSGSQLTF